MTLYDFGCLFEAIIVILYVLVDVWWQTEDHKIDLKYDPVIERLRTFCIQEEVKYDLRNEYAFWRSIHDLYYDAWVHANSKENKLKMGIECIDYGKIVLSIGDSILGKLEERNNEK